MQVDNVMIMVMTMKFICTYFAYLSYVIMEIAWRAMTHIKEIRNLDSFHHILPRFK